jgi:hypothetical protein
VESVTGLSRRSLLILAGAILLGVVASTVATVVSAQGKPGCSDAEYGCARFEAGEPVVIGVLSPRPEVRRAVRLVADLRGRRFAGRGLRVLAWNDRCTPRGGAAGARELATDSPDEPPVVASLGATCSTAMTPAAQILSDSGVTLASVSPTSLPDSAGDPRFYLWLGPVPTAAVASFEAAYAHRYGPPPPEAPPAAFATDTLLQVAESLARTDADGSLLVPRIPLRDALLEAGFVRSP